MADNVPVILPLLVFALAVLWRGRRWTDRLLAMLAGPASVRGRRIWGMVASLALIIVPTLGLVALAEALLRSRMLGPVGTGLAENLGAVGLILFAAIWLGSRAFPDGDGTGGIHRLHAHDPSWQNWPILEHAVIGNIVPDFPLINKSFNLSYAGQDL